MTIQTGTIVGIGKIVMNPLPQVIPPLSFIVIKNEVYTAVCIELNISVDAPSEQEVVDKLVNSCNAGIKQLFELVGDEAWDNLEALFNDLQPNSRYIKAFNAAQLTLAQKGVRLSSDEECCYYSL
jgi:hypothetical protein